MILMDINMPEMDGYEATRQIRKLEKMRLSESSKKIPIIAMTANVLQEDIDQCIACGMNAHIGKPLDHDEVIKKMLYYLNGSK